MLSGQFSLFIHNVKCCNVNFVFPKTSSKIQSVGCSKWYWNDDSAPANRISQMVFGSDGSKMVLMVFERFSFSFEKFANPNIWNHFAWPVFGSDGWKMVFMVFVRFCFSFEKKWKWKYLKPFFLTGFWFRWLKNGFERFCEILFQFRNILKSEHSKPSILLPIVSSLTKNQFQKLSFWIGLNQFFKLSSNDSSTFTVTKELLWMKRLNNEKWNSYLKLF